MLINPSDLSKDLDRLEDIERASLRLVVQGTYDYRKEAAEIFRQETDLPQDIAEDVTREALDRIGVSRINQRLFGKIDYKQARYVFHPEYALRQALFVDSKAEKVGGRGTATLQTSQTSMRIRQVRAGQKIDEAGKLPQIVELSRGLYLATTVFVKYNYDETSANQRQLKNITIACLPNGMLQARYNPTVEDTIWVAGRNAPSLGEEFRVRLSFSRLKQRARWRVQTIPASGSYSWAS